MASCVQCAWNEGDQNRKIARKGERKGRTDVVTDVNGRIAVVEGGAGAGDCRIEIWNAGQLGTRIITKRPGSN